MRPVVLKLGGELVEAQSDRARLAKAAAAVASSRPLVIVHGGGRAVDAAMARQGLVPTKIDGLRATDAAALDVVVSVLAGLTNTQLVAALLGQGVRAVGLTGADAGLGRAERSSAYQTADRTFVDLGFVGDPREPDATLLELLLAHGYVPVVASLGVDLDEVSAEPQVLNVNADVMACRLAAALTAELVIAGTTAGVLDTDGRTIDQIDLDDVDGIIADGTASAGMIAKLLACRTALESGAACVRIIDGRTLDQKSEIDRRSGTTIVRTRQIPPQGVTAAGVASQDRQL